METLCLTKSSIGRMGEEEEEDLVSGTFTWRIDNFSTPNKQKHYSDVFVVGGYKWRILIFPKGNNVDYLSVYLDVADASTLPSGWTRYARFRLTLVNQVDSKYSITRDTECEFVANKRDSGFTSFIPLRASERNILHTMRDKTTSIVHTMSESPLNTSKNTFNKTKMHI